MQITITITIDTEDLKPLLPSNVGALSPTSKFAVVSSAKGLSAPGQMSQQSKGGRSPGWTNGPLFRFTQPKNVSAWIIRTTAKSAVRPKCDVAGPSCP